MIIDITIILPFLALILFANRALASVFLIIAILVQEYFSMIPFGVHILFLTIPFSFLYYALSVADVSTKRNTFLIFIFALSIHAVLESLFFMGYFMASINEVLLRGSVFFMRESLLGIFAIFFIMSIRFAIHAFIYESVGQKTPF